MPAGLAVLGKVGPGFLQDGAEERLRLTSTGELSTSEAHGRYHEATIRGAVYSLTTAVAGVTVGAANVIGGANMQPLVGVFNPVNSGLVASILRCSFSLNSGTTGAGGLVWGYALNVTANITGTPTQSDINQKTFAVGKSGLITSINGALTGGTSVLLRHIGAPTVGAVAANANLSVIEETNGSIVVLPGVAVGIFAAAAGTSPIVNAAMEFEVLRLATN